MNPRHGHKSLALTFCEQQPKRPALSALRHLCGLIVEINIWQPGCRGTPHDLHGATNRIDPHSAVFHCSQFKKACTVVGCFLLFERLPSTVVHCVLLYTTWHHVLQMYCRMQLQNLPVNTLLYCFSRLDSTVERIDWREATQNKRIAHHYIIYATRKCAPYFLQSMWIKKQGNTI